METEKSELVNTVKEWLTIDNEIKQLQKEVKIRKQKKKNMTENLVDMMKSRDIDVMSLSKEQLIRTEKKVKAPLSKKHLLNCLLNYFKEDKETINNLGTFIMDSRPVKIKENIRRKNIK
tara:strand:- start:147 stop:503 length:357 start_codon:yes stop_codon:yes gene_type:complete